MKSQPKSLTMRQDAGIALLIAIFILLIISAIAISMIVASGTETALTGNYRSSASVYYAGLAGLEEGRGRLVKSNANYFNNTVANFIPTGTMAIGQVRYILNPLPGETVAPTSLANAATYPDNEYQTEFGAAVTGATVQTIPSVSTVAGIQGPQYKWVRITPATERSIGIDVNNDGVLDNTTPLFYDPAHVNANGNPQPSLIVAAVPPSTASQALEVTALGVLQDHSEKLVEYVVTPASYGLNFNSALTLAGSTVNFTGANSNQYYMYGTDGQGSPPAVPGCTPNATAVSAIGVTTAANVTSVDNALPRSNHYIGGTPTTSPSVSNVSSSLSPSLSTPAALQQLIQNISANADLVISNPNGTPVNATQSDMPSNMSVNNPMTVVVDGNFTMSGNYTGYGLLVVTGTFSYQGNDGWNGVILVIGSGTTTFNGSGGGNNEFNGAVFAATIYAANSSTLLPSLGTVDFDISGGGGNGINYNSCWIKAALQPPSWQVLSFREIAYSD